jgi:uncharacterized repeat protein (TIGR03803 family)
LSATYSKRVLYNFGGSPDGANPSASLLDMSGTLYGTTYRGGKADKGTIFAVTP